MNPKSRRPDPNTAKASLDAGGAPSTPGNDRFDKYDSTYQVQIDVKLGQSPQEIAKVFQEAYDNGVAGEFQIGDLGEGVKRITFTREFSNDAEVMEGKWLEYNDEEAVAHQLAAEFKEQMGDEQDGVKAEVTKALIFGGSLWVRFFPLTAPHYTPKAEPGVGAAAAIGALARLTPLKPASPGFHSPDCDCCGLGYFIVSGVDRGGSDEALAGPGEVILEYCGLEAAPTDEQILAHYGRPDAEPVSLKWGTYRAKQNPDLEVYESLNWVVGTRIAAKLEASGIEPQDLDGIVHDLADEIAAAEANQTDSGHDDSEERFASRSANASDVNNAGLAAQVSFMVETVGRGETEKLLMQHLGDRVPDLSFAPPAPYPVGTMFVLSVEGLDDYDSSDPAYKNRGTRITPAGYVWKIADRTQQQDGSTSYSVVCPETGGWINFDHSELRGLGFRTITEEEARKGWYITPGWTQEVDEGRAVFTLNVAEYWVDSEDGSPLKLGPFQEFHCDVTTLAATGKDPDSRALASLELCDENGDGVGIVFEGTVETCIHLGNEIADHLSRMAAKMAVGEFGLSVLGQLETWFANRDQVKAKAAAGMPSLGAWHAALDAVDPAQAKDAYAIKQLLRWLKDNLEEKTHSGFVNAGITFDEAGTVDSGAVLRALETLGPQIGSKAFRVLERDGG